MGAGDPPSAEQALTSSDVDKVVTNAASSVDSPLIVAVADRRGVPLAIFRTAGVAQNATSIGNFGQTVGAEDLAVALARTAAFFSNDQAPLSSRTVRFISGIHFPPGVLGTPNADLYGIENTNRGCSFNANYLPGQALPPAQSLAGGNGSGLGVITGKADVMDSDSKAVNPGGIPLFKQGSLVGGVGVVSVAGRLDVAEFAAFSGSSNSGFLPLSQFGSPGVVVVGGIELPGVNQTTQPSGTSAGSATGGTYDLNPRDGAPAPEGDLVGPNAGSALTQSEVKTIVDQAVATANLTRAVIRLPDGSRTKMTIAVADLNGNLLALHRMHDGTIFSTDVAVSKARNVIWFSSPAGSADLPGVPSGTAVTNRTISFGAQPLFPPGIDGSGPGPFFSLYLFDTAHPCTQGSQPANQYQSGIVFFPSSAPLYKNGVLVGGLGVSGDGVDQDDYVTSGGAQG
ncbi:MAG: heme-binding protein, partial [Acidobacteriaceae bacterium]|nr:heme-binding protein [Acidobacteriaceae bacterium]